MKKIIMLSTLLMGGVAHAQSGLPNLPGILNSVPGMVQQTPSPSPAPQSDPCQHSNTYSLDPNNPNPNGCIHTQAPPPETAHKVTI